jgi:hypothetical protein
MFLKRLAIEDVGFYIEDKWLPVYYRAAWKRIPWERLEFYCGETK